MKKIFKNNEKGHRVFRFILLFLLFIAIFLLGTIGYKKYQNYSESIKIVSNINANSIKNPIEAKSKLINNESPYFYGDSNKGVDSPTMSDLINLQDLAKKKGITKQQSGFLVINKIGQTLPIYRGANQYTLSLGVATYFYDDPVMGSGNYVLAGHNMESSGVLLSDLNNLVNGDAMDLISEDTVFRYRVDKIEIVPEYMTLINGKPEAGSFLSLPEKGEKPKLTLFNCIYTNKGKERYVVQGHLTNVYPNK